MILEHADEDAVRRSRARAVVRNLPLKDALAGDVAVYEGLRRASRLQPMDVVEIGAVETHRANLMQKLALHSTAEIVLYAVRKGIIV